MSLPSLTPKRETSPGSRERTGLALQSFGPLHPYPFLIPQRRSPEGLPCFQVCADYRRQAQIARRSSTRFLHFAAPVLRSSQ